jgi:hypothetical protein
MDTLGPESEGIHPDLDPSGSDSDQSGLDPRGLDPHRSGYAIGSCYDQSGSGSARTVSVQIWIRPDLIPTRADLDPPGSDSELNRSDPIGVDPHSDLDPIGSGSESVRIRDLDSTGPGTLALVRQDLSCR